MEAATTSQAGSADLSCVACRRLKRKCSKDRPACSLCHRVGRLCQYPPLTPSSPGSATQSGRYRFPAESPPTDDHRKRRRRQTYGLASLSGDANGSAGPASPTSAPAAVRPRFPAVWYLDSMTAKSMAVSSNSTLQWSDVEGVFVEPSMDEVKSAFREYRDSVHHWLPVVSVIRISRLLASAPFISNAGTMALFVAMQLLSGQPSSDGVDKYREATYDSLKAALASCERLGQFSTDLLAAEVLTAVFEVANGLYPAAYFSVGTCSRVCFSMGIHDKRQATQLNPQVSTWTEQEEQRRLFWATLTLDRYIHIGFLHRPLSIPYIDPDEIIPAHDDEWDKGELTVNPLLVMSIDAQTAVSPYARLCQAAHLLGRVCQHVNEHQNPSDPQFHFQEAYSIERAVRALLSMLQQEAVDTSPERRHHLFGSIGLCCSALHAFYEMHSCIEQHGTPAGSNTGHNTGSRIELQAIAIDGYKRTADIVRNLTVEVHRSIDVHGVGTVSPFITHSLYQAAGIYAWRAAETGNETYVAYLDQIRQLLKMIQLKWQVAGQYLELLEGAEMPSTSLTPQAT